MTRMLCSHRKEWHSPCWMENLRMRWRIETLFSSVVKWSITTNLKKIFPTVSLIKQIENIKLDFWSHHEENDRWLLPQWYIVWLLYPLQIVPSKAFFSKMNLNWTIGLQQVKVLFMRNPWFPFSFIKDLGKLFHVKRNRYSLIFFNKYLCIFGTTHLVRGIEQVPIISPIIISYCY